MIDLPWLQSFISYYISQPTFKDERINWFNYGLYKLHYNFIAQIYLGGCDKPVSPLIRRAAVTVKARSLVFIKAQELSHFNDIDNSLSDTVNPAVDAIENSWCCYSY